MPNLNTGFTHDEVAAFGHKLGEWAGRLDDTQKAMLIDLLAKAGGDVYGHDAAQRLTSPDGKETDASALSPLEYDDFTHAIEGIFNARRETEQALGR